MESEFCIEFSDGKQRKGKKNLTNIFPKKFLKLMKDLKFGELYWGMNYLMKYRAFDFFRNINIEINTSCTRRCSYCPNSVFDRGLIKNQKLMDEEVYKKVIDELAEIGFDGEISPVHYGEPLLDKRIFRLIKYTRQKLPRSNIKLFSNGDLLSIENYNKLIDSGMSELALTKHEGPEPLKIKKLISYVKKNPNKKVKLIYRGFDLEKTPLLNRGGLVKSKITDYTPICTSSSNPVVIDVEGNVILCCNDYLSSIKLGNIKKEKLLDIWRSKRFKRIRKELKDKKFRFPICRKCVGLEK